MDTKNTTACRVPFHDSMPSFMNFRRVLDLLENKVSQCFAGNQKCPSVWNSFPFIAWDLSMHPRTWIWFFNQFICTGACACSSNLNYAHKMPRKPSYCIKMCPNKPEKFQNLTQHSCCSMLTLEFFESNMRQRISFRPQRWHVPYRNHHACCEKLIPKPTPNGTNFLPRHVDAAPW